MLNFKQIEAFRAVMLSGSMTLAAKELNTTQSNISRVIALLERRLGVRLFDRSGGKLLPTVEGNIFMRDVELAFASLRNLENSAESLRRQGCGKVRISTAPSAALFLVPRSIERFSRRYPDVDITLHVSDSLTVCQWIASGLSDIGIASDVRSSPGVEYQVVDQSTGVCLVPASHRLAKQPGALTPQDLAHEKFLSLSQNDVMRKHIDKLFESDGHDARVLSYESHFAASNLQLVALGIGLTIANPLYTRHLIPEGVVVKDFTPSVVFPTYLVHPTGVAANELARRFGECFRETLAEAA